MDMLWHYTVGENWELIRENGVLIPGFNNPFIPKGERPANWFTTNQEYESTIGKVYYCDGRIVGYTTRQDLIDDCGGLVRIGVAPETAPHDWNEFKRLSGIQPKLARGLYNSAIEQGSRPRDWRVTFDPVPQSAWLSVEFWNGAWRPDRQLQAA